MGNRKQANCNNPFISISSPYIPTTEKSSLVLGLISSPRRLAERSAVSVFSHDADVSPKLSTFRPFGCPVYALSNELAAGQGLPKWNKRARVGIYLGQSPKHARSVALVLNIKTGLVSPQFHVVFNDMLETVGGKGDSYELGWLMATHFSPKTTSRRPAAPSHDRNIQNATTTASNIPIQQPMTVVSTNPGASPLAEDVLLDVLQELSKPHAYVKTCTP